MGTLDSFTGNPYIEGAKLVINGLAQTAPSFIDLLDPNDGQTKAIRNQANLFIDDANQLSDMEFRGSNAALNKQSVSMPFLNNIGIDDLGGKESLLGTGINSAIGSLAGLNPLLTPKTALDVVNAARRNKERQRQVDRVNKLIQDANNRMLTNFNTAVNTTDQTNDRWQLQNMYNMNYSQGGLLETNGATWSTGSDFINNGGTHEANPFGGVQYGVASDGIPNYVEEGEVVIDLPEDENMGHSYAEGGSPNTSKFVMSNRVLLEEPELELLRKVTDKPEKYLGKSYASIYKDLFKKNGIEERINNPETKDFIKTFNSRIAKTQETAKMRKQQEEFLAALKKASPEEQDMIMQQFGINPQQPMQGEYLAAQGGEISIKPSKRGTFTSAAKKRGMGVQEFASKVLANKEDYSPAMVKKANFARNFGGHKHSNGGYLYQDGGLYSVRQTQPYKNVGVAGQWLPFTPQDPTFEYWDANSPTGYKNEYYTFATNPDNYTADSRLMQSLQRYYNDKGFKGTLTPEKAMYWATDKKGGGFHDIVAQAYADSLAATATTPEIILPTGPQPINRYWTYDWDTGERTPITEEEFNNPTNGWSYDAAFNEEGRDDENDPNFYRDFYLTNHTSNTNTSKPTTPYQKEGVNSYDWILPAISGATLLGDVLGLTNRPDYSNAARIERATLEPRYIDYNPNGRYIKPQLVDSRYVSSKLGNQGLAGISAARDLSGANRATALANISAQNYLTQQAMGEALANSQIANNAALQQAIQLNNAVDAANAQGAFQADAANQQAWENYAKRYAEQRTKGALLREETDKQVAANRSTNWNNFLENLEGYFENQRNRDMANLQYAWSGYQYIGKDGKTHLQYNTPEEERKAKRFVEKQPKDKQKNYVVEPVER